MKLKMATNSPVDEKKGEKGSLWPLNRGFLASMRGKRVPLCLPGCVVGK